MPRRDGQVGECVAEGLGLVGLVPGRHGRVGREDAPLARPRERVVERGSRGDVVRGELERRERRMPLVEVQDAGLDPERPERAHGADPEQPVLSEARERVPLVEAGGDPPVDGVVLVELRVEEVERDAADLDAPHVERDVPARERERQAERRPVVRQDLHGREVLGDDLRPVLVLEARAVDALLEVALAVEEADADDGQGEVARLLEDVPRERSQAAGVDRERRMDAELRADEGDRAVETLDMRVRPGAIVLEHLRQPRDALTDRDVTGGGLGRVRQEVLELAHRVAAVELPREWVERAEELGAVGVPRPAVVERDPRERRELRR